jgi:hypothetical protein
MKSADHRTNCCAKCQNAKTQAAATAAAVVAAPAAESSSNNKTTTKQQAAAAEVGKCQGLQTKQKITRNSLPVKTE